MPSQASTWPGACSICGEVITLVNSPHRSNPFGESVKAFLYNFSQPHELEKSLRGVDVLINTYWVRFDRPPHFTFAQALANAKVLRRRQTRGRRPRHDDVGSRKPLSLRDAHGLRTFPWRT